MKIQDYINLQKSRGLTYDQIVQKTKVRMRWVEEKRNRLLQIKAELDNSKDEFQLWKWTRKVSEKLADPTKTVTYKTLNHNLSWVTSTEEARFLMDVCS